MKEQSMKKILIVLVWCLLILGLVSCQEEKTSYKLVEKPTLLLKGVGFDVDPTVISLNNQTLVLLNAKKGLTLYTLGKEVLVSSDRAGKQWLRFDGKSLYAFWWTANEYKEKSLKIAVSSDGGQNFSPAKVINTKKGVLQDISIAVDGQGKVAVAYTDEREPGYGVYFNYSTDSGQTWLNTDQRLDSPLGKVTNDPQNNNQGSTFANSPKLAFINGQLIGVWQQVDASQMGGTTLRLISKTSMDGGKTWGAESNIFAAPNMQPLEFEMFANNKEMYIFANLPAEYGGRGLVGFYNKDPSFSAWGEITNDALGTDYQKALVSGFKGIFSGDNLILTYTALVPGHKLRAELAVLSTGSHTWLGAAKSLDVDNNSKLTKSAFPSVVNAGVTGDYIVWEDYSPLMPAIYISNTKDNGKTWTEPEPLTTPGLVLAKEPQLLVHDNELWLMYFMVGLNTNNSMGEWVYQSFPKKESMFELPKIQVNQPTVEELKQQLIERVNKFWVLREEGKWAETWDYMNPVYRKGFNKEQWLAQQGKISFAKTVVDESSVKIDGNIAELKANVEINVPQQVATEGLLESAPPKVQSVDMRWGWFYDNWYFIPEMIFNDYMEY